MPSTPTLFISDLHLSPERPAPVELFQRFAKEVVPGCAALYILGDFFEAWVGDDDLDSDFNARMVARLRELNSQGVPVFFMPGNRDFIVGDAFAKAAGLDLLPDPTRIDLYSVPTLLAHGDAFCIDDPAYQALRRQVRDPGWQAMMLEKPLAERHALARMLRERSEQAKAGKKPDIMDVNQDEVARTVQTWGVARLIHGHTHRPARHMLDVAGQAVERWVLPDWYETGGYLRCDEEGCRSLDFF